MDTSFTPQTLDGTLHTQVYSFCTHKYVPSIHIALIILLRISRSKILKMMNFISLLNYVWFRINFNFEGYSCNLLFDVLILMTKHIFTQTRTHNCK